MDNKLFINQYYGTMASFNTDTYIFDLVSGKNLVKTGWHYLVVSIDNTINKQLLYIDGVLSVLNSSTLAINYSGVGQNTFIGKHGNKSNFYNFTGRIDEVRIYRIGCTQDYIKLCYMNQKQSDALVVHKL